MRSLGAVKSWLTYQRKCKKSSRRQWKTTKIWVLVDHDQEDKLFAESTFV